ncbi:MAG: hypothetical protein LVR00_05495 [Rhabdochlamydiaceae bacterium]|jgi:DHA2 family multidrug resistance protein
MILGVVCFILSSFYPTLFDTNIDFFHIALSRFFFGIGVTLFITPAFALSLQDIPSPSLPSATGLFHFVRAMVGGFGTSIFTTLWERRTSYHHEVLGEHATPFSWQTNEMLTDLSTQGLKGQEGLAALNVIVDQQAAMLGLNDCFYIMGWVFIFLIPILSAFYIYGRRGNQAQALVVKN